MKHAAATLGSGNLRNAVQLPDGEDLNEWVAVNSKFEKSMLFNIIFLKIIINKPTSSLRQTTVESN
jgi:Mob1/phocein family